MKTDYLLGFPFLWILAILAGTLTGVIITRDQGVFVLGVFLAGVVVFFRPDVGLILMLLFIPLEQVFTINQSTTLIRVVGVVAFSGWLLRVLLDGKKIKTGKPFWLLTLLLVWCFSSVAWATDAGSSLTRLVMVVQLAAFYLMGCNLINCREKLNFYSTFYVIGVLVSAVVSIYLAQASDFTIRASVSEMQNPNWFGRSLGVGLILSIYLAVSSGRFIYRISYSLIAIAALAGIMFSGTRGVWLTLVATLFITIILIKDVKLKLLVIALALTIAIFSSAIVDLLPPMVGDRVASIGENLGNRGAGRMDIWMVGWEMVKDNSLLGVGLGNFPEVYNDYLVEAPPETKDRGINRDPHNTMLSVAAELGMVGFTLFMAMLAATLAALKKVSNNNVRILGISLLAYLFLGSFSGTWHYHKYFWFGLIVPAAMAFFPCDELIDRGRME